MMRDSRLVVALAGVTGALVLVAYGCSTVECGPGTAEKDGKCVAGGDLLCGEGTHLNQATLRCEPDVYTCDPNTADVNDAGVCIGRITGTLPTPKACPAQVPNSEICVNGWLRDFDTKGKEPFSKDTLITDSSTEVWVFDPFLVLLCTTPPCMDTTQAIAGPFYPEADGTFLLDKDTAGRPIKATGSFIAIGVINRDNSADGPWTPAGITADGKGGITIENFDIYAVSKAQTAAWETTEAGLLDAGVFITMWHYLDKEEADYSKNRTFVEGVLPNRAPGEIDITTLYFMTDDRDTLVKGVADGVKLTTLVGGVLMKQEGLTNHSATGGFVPGTQDPITWEVRQGASVPGLVFLQFFTQSLQ